MSQKSDKVRSLYIKLQLVQTAGQVIIVLSSCYIGRAL